MYQNIFTDIGLSNNEAIVYEILLKNGQLTAGEIIKKSPLKRGVVYNALADLEAKELINQTTKGKIASWIASHPEKLRTYLQDKENEVAKAKNTLEANISNIVSDFNLISGQPGVRYFEGIEGLKKIYNEILKENKNFYLIRSGYEPVYQKKIVPIINKFIKKRVEKKIRVIAITPTDINTNRHPEQDEKWLMERIWVDKNKYNAPVEIDIFGNKVAILSFGKELIGMIIESEQIALSLKQLFNLSQLALTNQQTNTQSS